MAARYRRPDAASPDAAPPVDTTPIATTPVAKNLEKAVKEKAAHDASTGFSIMDILRILGGILLLSSGVSYLSTSGESMTWGYNAWWTRAREWKVVFNRPVTLTDTQLLAYDGTDPTKPIYLALNGTIYDVSAARSTYGPGGSYHFFAGRDAARAFLTGCFAEDSTPDLRGVEEMFIPVDPETKPDASPEVIEKAKARRKLTSGELKNRRTVEGKRARQMARDGLEGWHSLFRGDKGKPYFKAGEVRREPGWEEKLPKRGLCEQAEKGRKVRTYEE